MSLHHLVNTSVSTSFQFLYFALHTLLIPYIYSITLFLTPNLTSQGLGLDNAHSGIFSDLAVLYSKYSPEKLMEHIKVRYAPHICFHSLVITPCCSADS